MMFVEDVCFPFCNPDTMGHNKFPATSGNTAPKNKYEHLKNQPKMHDWRILIAHKQFLGLLYTHCPTKQPAHMLLVHLDSDITQGEPQLP